jgi:hypothetical protein
MFSSANRYHRFCSPRGALSLEVKGSGHESTALYQPVPRLRTRGAVPPPPYAFMMSTGTTLRVLSFRRGVNEFFALLGCYEC